MLSVPCLCSSYGTADSNTASWRCCLFQSFTRTKTAGTCMVLIKGIPKDALRLFSLSEKLPKYIRDKRKEGFLVYDWEEYRKRFGFVDIEPIEVEMQQHDT